MRFAPREWLPMKRGIARSVWPAQSVIPDLEDIRRLRMIEDVVPALVDFARCGDREGFDFLLGAATQVPQSEWDALWAATVKRVPRSP
jgi:hypothetical protein